MAFGFCLLNKHCFKRLFFCLRCAVSSILGHGGFTCSLSDIKGNARHCSVTLSLGNWDSIHCHSALVTEHEALDNHLHNLAVGAQTRVILCWTSMLGVLGSEEILESLEKSRVKRASHSTINTYSSTRGKGSTLVTPDQHKWDVQFRWTL